MYKILKILSDVNYFVRFAVSPIDQRQNAQDCLAGCAGIQLMLKPFPYALVSLSRQQIIPYLRVPKSLWLKGEPSSEGGKLYKSAEPEVAGPLQLLQCARQLEFVVAFLPLVSGLCIQMAEPARGESVKALPGKCSHAP